MEKTCISTVGLKRETAAAGLSLTDSVERLGEDQVALNAVDEVHVVARSRKGEAEGGEDAGSLDTEPVDEGTSDKRDDGRCGISEGGGEVGEVRSCESSSTLEKTKDRAFSKSGPNSRSGQAHARDQRWRPTWMARRRRALRG